MRRHLYYHLHSRERDTLYPCRSKALRAGNVWFYMRRDWEDDTLHPALIVSKTEPPPDIPLLRLWRTDTGFFDEVKDRKTLKATKPLTSAVPSRTNPQLAVFELGVYLYWIAIANKYVLVFDHKLPGISLGKTPVAHTGWMIDVNGNLREMWLPNLYLPPKATMSADWRPKNECAHVWHLPSDGNSEDKRCYWGEVPPSPDWKVGLGPVEQFESGFNACVHEDGYIDFSDPLDFIGDGH